MILVSRICNYLKIMEQKHIHHTFPVAIFFITVVLK